MATRYLGLALALAVVAVAGFSACSGDDADSRDKENMLARVLGRERLTTDDELTLDGADEAATGGASTAADGAAQSVDSPSNSSGSSGPGGRSQPQARPNTNGAELLRAASNALARDAHKLTYELRGKEPGLGDVNGTLTLASRDRQERIGLTGDLGGDQGSFIAIHSGPANFLCIEGRGDSACLKTKADEAAPLQVPSVFKLEGLLDRLANAGGDVREVGGQQIAGYDGRCFEAGSQSGNGLVCIAEAENLVLLVNGHFQGADFEVRLQEYTQPTDADFEPPFPVTELP